MKLPSQYILVYGGSRIPDRRDLKRWKWPELSPVNLPSLARPMPDNVKVDLEDYRPKYAKEYRITREDTVWPVKEQELVLIDNMAFQTVYENDISLYVLDMGGNNLHKFSKQEEISPIELDILSIEGTVVQGTLNGYWFQTTLEDSYNPRVEFITNTRDIPLRLQDIKAFKSI